MTKAREYKYEWDVLYLKCTQCGKRWTVNDYQKCKRRKFWLQPWCKACNRIKRVKFYWENKERLTILNKEYCKNNREKLSKRTREYCRKNRDKVNQRMREYRKNNRDKIKEYTKWYIKNRSEEIWFSWRWFHNKATLFVKKYWLRPDICPICREKKEVVIHHPSYHSYEDWSKIVFCCARCHNMIHTWEINCPTPIDLLTFKK